jgi:hypothetical protein
MVKSLDDVIARLQHKADNIKTKLEPSYFTECIDYLKSLPKCDDGWIPCSSGKMPADYGEDWVQIQIQEIDTGYLWIPRAGEYRRGSWWVLGYDEDVRVKPPFEVLAWRELPPAYVKGD